MTLRLTSYAFYLRLKPYDLIPMDIKTYRAKTMRDALDLVRRELGPSAAVLHTREVNSGPLRRLVFGRRYEIAASTAVNVPSRLPAELHEVSDVGPEVSGVGCQVSERAFGFDGNAELSRGRVGVGADANLIADYRARYREDFRRQMAGRIDELHAMVDKLCDQAASAPAHDLPEAVFQAFTDLIEADVDESIAREWIDEIRGAADARTIADANLVKSRVAELLENEIRVHGPISTVADKCRLVALVGPTGVGKTTTIAKLAANYRLREKSAWA